MEESVDMPRCPYIDESALKPFRGAGLCEHCGIQCNCRECHHIFGRGMGGAWRIDHRYFLMGLCRECHDKYQHEIIPREEACIRVGKREGIRPQWIQEQFWRMRRTPK